MDCFASLAMTTTSLPPLPLRKMPGQKLRQHLDARGPRSAGWRHPMQRAFRLLPAFQDHLDFPGCDGFADDELGQVGDAEASEKRRHDGLAIVDAQATAGPHARLLAGGV